MNIKKIENDAICYLLFAICYLLFTYLFFVTGKFLSLLSFTPLIFISEVSRKKLFFIFYFLFFTFYLLFFINNLTVFFYGYRSLGDAFVWAYSGAIFFLISIGYFITISLNLKSFKFFTNQIFLLIIAMTFVIPIIIGKNMSQEQQQYFLRYSIIFFTNHIIWLIYRKEWRLLPFYNLYRQKKQK